MTLIYHEPTQEMQELASRVFGYKGKSFRTYVQDSYTLSEYWSGGTKSRCALVKRDGLEIHYPSNATTNPFNAVAHQTFQIPPGTFVIEHKYFRGNDMGITFYVRPGEMDTAILPPQIELTLDEKIVLTFTCRYKSSYRLDEAARYTKITRARWDEAKHSLIERKLLKRNGAVTVEARNAVIHVEPYALGQEAEALQEV